MSTTVVWDPDWPGAEFAPGEVHVGRLDVERTDWDLEAHLTSDELERASSFHFDVDRDRYITSRGALRSLLARYLHVTPRSVEIVTDQGGKPRLSGHPDSIQFNVSHSGPIVVIGITQGVPIGIDVEKIDPEIPHQDMAGRFFSPRELAVFESLPVDRRIDHFFAVWTRKEAYLKGIGEGLSLPPDGFSVTVDENATLVDDPSRSDRWWTAGIDVAHGFEAALAVPRPNWTIRPFEIVALVG